MASRIPGARPERDALKRSTSTSVRTAPSRRASVRPSVRALTTRHASLRAPADRAGAISPADSVMSSATTAAGTKRKERPYEAESGSAEETNISVYVRSRGRSEREVKENSNVVVKTEGVKGNLMELMMGPNALNNKTYSFDGVFSPAAGQDMIFDEVVKPILDEMLAGFNCTIFAYGQTGTGKTYTMSGDVSETLGILSDEAGIIPRVLKGLFDKLQVDSGENCVKVSFIELYNEELRDLISVEEAAKLKIYDDVKKGHATTVVQGMEEKHINSASEGITVLQEGSLKRQVAATKCNDLSSRSHTVFSITAYVRIPGENGAPDELVSAGKLNLVDLAGSENIQRSGAENKRAAEAGLINKSLLTLGRVINALVDRSQHIPYRESKLTRLLQDSLGGRTKTCIIATVSPAKSNLEETISTLDYAFRAKNIRNRPRINQPINKKALLRDFANEIERLKTELICHRQRSGVYLSNEAYEDLAAVSESRRIMLEEHAEKLETVETSLRNKAQELLMLTATFMGLKKDHEGVKTQLDETKEVLDQAELVLETTRRSLAEETHLRKAHQRTEEQLVEVGGKLLSTLERTVGDVDGLRAKSKRKSDIQALNRTAWQSSQAQVADATELVEERVLRLRDEQSERIGGIAERMRGFVDEELRQLSETQAFLEGQLTLFGDSKRGLLERGGRSKEDMDGVLEEIMVVRDSVKERVGESLQVISGAADRISKDVVTELDTFHNQLHTSYSALGKDFKTIFEDLTRHLVTQRSESERLRRQLQGAARTMMDQSDALARRIQDVVEEERAQAAEDRQQLMAQIGALVSAQAEAQENRLAEKAALLSKGLTDASSTLEASVERYDQSMEAWDKKEGRLLEDVKGSRDTLKTRLQDDWNTANDHNNSIQATARSVHAQTVRVVDEQISDLGVQMQALDDFVSRARAENAQHHEAQRSAVTDVASTVEGSYENIGSHFRSTFDRVKTLGSEMEAETRGARGALEPVEDEVCAPLKELRGGVAARVLREYEPTGTTPEKTTYRFPRELPHTESHEVLLARMNGEGVSPSKKREATPPVYEDEAQKLSVSPDLGIPVVKAEAEAVQPLSINLDRPSSEPKSDDGRGEERGTTHPMSMSLREINPNVTANFSFDAAASTMSMPENVTLPLLKSRGKKGPRKGVGRENMVVELPKRKSPRLN